MNIGLLRLARRHRDHPGIRVWACADGTRIAAVGGDYTASGSAQVIYWRADLPVGTFFGHPTRPGGDERIRAVAREFILHNGCCPRADGLDRGAGSRPTVPDRLSVAAVVREVLAMRRSHLALARRGRRRVNPLVAEKWVRIMCDYCADGLWSKRGGACDLADLPVSAELLARIALWQAWFEKCPSDGRGWPDIEAFSAEGESIARAVKAELPDWTVIYHDEAKAEALLRQGRESYQRAPRQVFEYEIHRA
jgi:hypothetical protein